MTSRSLLLFIVMIFAAVSVGGHDLFLRLHSYFLQTNSRASVGVND